MSVDGRSKGQSGSGGWRAALARLGRWLRGGRAVAAPSPTQPFRDQHQELLALASQLQACLDDFQRTGKGEEVRECLSRFLGRLETHLIAEDCFMYPALMAHPERDLSLLAQRFAGDMQGMKPAFSALGRRWSSAAVIEAAPLVFVAEVTASLHHLRARIEREDQELYALADRHGDLSFY